VPPASNLCKLSATNKSTAQSRRRQLVVAFAVALAFLSVILRAAEDLLLLLSLLLLVPFCLSSFAQRRICFCCCPCCCSRPSVCHPSRSGGSASVVVLAVALALLPVILRAAEDLFLLLSLPLLLPFCLSSFAQRRICFCGCPCRCSCSSVCHPSRSGGSASVVVLAVALALLPVILRAAEDLLLLLSLPLLLPFCLSSFAQRRICFCCCPCCCSCFFFCHSIKGICLSPSSAKGATLSQPRARALGQRHQTKEGLKARPIRRHSQPLILYVPRP